MESISLTELSNVVSRTIGMAFPSTYWVRAEISELHVNRHAYFELVDKSGSGGQISAKMRATCWSNIYSMLSAYFEQQTSRRLSVGMKVLLEVEVSYHNVYGMSLNICNINPEYTIGDMARERQQTIERLRKDGTFEMQQSLSLPTLVKHVAVVSSSAAAGQSPAWAGSYTRTRRCRRPRPRSFTPLSHDWRTGPNCPNPASMWRRWTI